LIQAYFISLPAGYSTDAPPFIGEAGQISLKLINLREVKKQRCFSVLAGIRGENLE
jgi:hypothetical protein